MQCAVLVDRPLVPSWQHRCIDYLRTHHDVHVIAWPGTSVPGKFTGTVLRALARCVLRAEPVECVTELPDAIDMVIDLRACAPAPAPGVHGRFGVWYFADAQGRAWTPASAAAEIAAGSPTFTILLCRRAAHGAAVKRRGRFKVLYTYARSLEVALGECARWPLICSKSAKNGQSDEALLRIPSGTAPGVSLLAFAYRQTRVLAVQVMVYFLTDAVWKVGIVNAPPAAFLNPGFAPAINWVKRGESEFLADPFVLHADSRTWILAESLDRTSRNGYISCTEMHADGKTELRQTVLRARTHLSYPYTFLYQNEWYVVPESADEYRVSLYKIVEMPHRWERVATLLEGVPACDSTIFRAGGRWWLFCTIRSRDANLNLFGYYADDLRGPWLEHAANPLKTDISSARPAGAPFTVNGRLYRPAQDCSIAYGDRIVICRITKLTPSDFSEETVASFGHNHGQVFRTGNHTLSHAGGTSVIDAKQTVLASPKVVFDRAVHSYHRLRMRTHGG